MEQTPEKMKYVRVENAGLKVSEISFGAMTFS